MTGAAKSWRQWRATLRGSSGGLLLAVATASTAFAFAGKQPKPETQLSFTSLGVPPLSATLLTAGASMLTVNFVDTTHLLVTYGSRGLVHREEGDPADDQDRMVAAELVELPTGKVLTRTEWHLHDHGRYLWPLGSGRFLLRVRGDLSVLTPLAHLGDKDPWLRTTFPHRRGGALQAIELSADDRLVGVITAPANHVSHAELTPQPSHTVNVGGMGELVDRTAGFVYIDFYRLSGTGAESSPVELQHAGIVRAPDAIRLPVNGDGYLRTRGGAKGNWKVSFESYEGASKPLAAVGSSCPPVLNLTSRAQLLAFTCRGGMDPDAITMMAFDFAGHEMWEEPIGDVPVTPSFAYAPVAGRFAMSRLMPQASGTQIGGAEMPVGPVQELRVYQMQSGDLLLKVAVSPTFRTAENYDLSPDGMHAAVVHEGEIDLYRLPELSKADREDLEDVAKMEPPLGGKGPVNLRKLVEDDAQPAPLKEAEGTVGPTPGLAAPGKAGQADVQVVQNGDSEALRKPPTLLNPGEKAEYKGKDVPR